MKWLKLAFAKKERGSTIITVIYIMVIIVIIMTSLGSIFSNNLRQATAQEKNMKVYYLALSGIDMGMSALMQKNIDGESLLSLEYTNSANPSVSNTPVLSQHLEVDTGTIDIQISSYEDSSNERWVEVVSTGKLDYGNVEKTSRLKFLVANPEIQKRK